MSATEATAESTGVTNLNVSGGEAGPAPVAIVVSYGFWIFLLSDIIMFSALFATYAVLSGQTDGGPSGRELFDTRNVAIETLCLLFSSYTCGLGSVFLERRSLSAFFALVGLHGAHVSIGLIWLAFMVAQTAAKGPREFVLRRLRCFSLFWHALDIIWVAVMSLVYLMAVRV